MGGQLLPVNRGTTFGSIVRSTWYTEVRTLTCIRLKSNKLFMFTSRRNNFCTEYSAPCPRFFGNADVPLAAFCDLLVCVHVCFASLATFHRALRVVPRVLRSTGFN